MEGLIDGAFARVLEAGRPRFNALYAQAGRSHPRLEPAAFAEHLRGTVAPVVEEVAREAPGREAAVGEFLFELSLELVGKDLLGPRSRVPALAAGWSALLRGLPRHLAAEPQRFVGSVTNALYNLTLVPEARVSEWVERMLRLGARCPDVPALLEAGKVLAWRSGLAHYREGTLEVCQRLPADLAAAALGLPEGAGAPPLSDVLARLREDPWMKPAALRSASARKQLRIVGSAGAFRGFGGVFLRPPLVACAGGQFFAHDGESCWLLHADVFGSTLHRVSGQLPASDRNPTFRLDPDGRVTYGRQSAVFAELKGASSSAANSTTLAVTSPLSHRVTFVAWTQESA